MIRSLVIMGCVLLAACQSAKKAEEDQASRDNAVCREAGYAPGSDAFAKCLADTREQRAAVNRSLKSVNNENIRSSISAGMAR